MRSAPSLRPRLTNCGPRSGHGANSTTAGIPKRRFARLRWRRRHFGSTIFRHPRNELSLFQYCEWNLTNRDAASKRIQGVARPLPDRRLWLVDSDCPGHSPRAILRIAGGMVRACGDNAAAPKFLMGDHVQAHLPFILKWILVILGLLLVAGVRFYVLLAFGFGFLVLLFDMLTKGFGEFFNHAQVGLLYGAWILAVFPQAADGLSVRRRKREKTPSSPRYAAPMVAMTLTLCLCYSIIGVRRLLVGGRNFSWRCPACLSVREIS